MKRLIIFGAETVFSLLCLSCTKDLNPKPEPHVDVDFSLNVEELRQSHTFLWNVLDAGVMCAEQSIQEIWVTDWNKCEVVSFSDDPSFDGVNFSSSSPEIVKVVKTGEATCQLVRVGDSSGEGVVITASTGENTHSFVVFSKSVIPLESVHVRYGYEDYWLKKDATQKYPYMVYADQQGCYKYRLGKKRFGYADVEGVRFFDENMDEVTLESETTRLEILGLVPENASFRYVVNWYSCNSNKVSSWDNAFCIIPKEVDPWPAGHNEKSAGFMGLDWAEIQGSHTEVLLPGLFCSFSFLVGCDVPEQPKRLSEYRIGETETYRFWGVYEVEGLKELP